MRLLTLLAITTSLISCSNQLLVNSALNSAMSDNTMTTKTGILIKSISLMAREERSLPSGLKPTSDRDIGFAAVFVELENTQETDTQVVIQSVQIRNTITGGIQLESQKPQSIHLHPLEISANQFQLMNKLGYSRLGKVKAIITYQIGNQKSTIESAPVEVEQH